MVERVLAQLSTACRRVLQCCHRSSGACRHALNGSGSPMTKFDLNSGVGSLPISRCAPRNGKSDTAGRRTQDRPAIPPCLARKWFVRGGIRRCVLVLARCPFRGVHHEMVLHCFLLISCWLPNGTVAADFLHQRTLLIFSTPARHRGLQALPLHAPSAAVLPHSGMPSGRDSVICSSNTAFHSG